MPLLFKLPGALPPDIHQAHSLTSFSSGLNCFLILENFLDDFIFKKLIPTLKLLWKGRKIKIKS